jgi:hypothetical protein
MNTMHGFSVKFHIYMADTRILWTLCMAFQLNGFSVKFHIYMADTRILWTICVASQLNAMFTCRILGSYGHYAWLLS